MYKETMNRSQFLNVFYNHFIFLISIVGYFQGIYIIFFSEQPNNPVEILYFVPFFVCGLFVWFLAKDKYPRNRNIAKRLLFFWPLLQLGFFIPYYIFLKKKK